MPSGLEESLLLFTLAHGLNDFRQQQIELKREFVLLFCSVQLKIHE